MKFLFILPGVPYVYGFRRDEFVWVEEHKAYVFNGKPVYAEKFNEISKYVFDKYRVDEPEVKCLLESPPTPEELVSDAIVTLKHFAPELLKPTPGRKPGKKQEPAMAGT
jgi:hypothetical protein